MDYSQKTQDLIDRQCRNVERLDFTLDKPLAEELIMKTYDLFNLPRPKKVKWCVDLEDQEFQESAASLSAWKVNSWMGARECLRLEIVDGTWKKDRDAVVFFWTTHSARVD